MLGEGKERAMAEIHTLNVAGKREDELLVRLIDGECSPQERLDIEERLANDETLRARLEQFRQNDHLIRAVVSSHEQSVPPSVVNTLKMHAVKSPQPRGFRHPVALAASLLLATAAVLVSNVWQLPTSQTPQLDSLFVNALDTLPSRADGWDSIDDERALRMVLTFPAADGKWCREFMLASEDSHWRGVACRDSGSWVTQVIGRDVFLEQVGGYRTAGATDNDTVAQFIDETATDIALSRDEEEVLIATDWSLKSR